MLSLFLVMMSKRKEGSNRKKVIIITGSPGVGKSSLALLLEKKLGFLRFDISQYYRNISSGYNRKKQSYDIDLKKFERLVREKKREAEKGLIVDSHIAHLLPKRMVDLCVVLVCSDLKKLEKRLEARKYSKEKIRENLDAEIFQVCLIEAKEKGHKVIMFDMCPPLTQNDVIEKIRKSL